MEIIEYIIKYDYLKLIHAGMTKYNLSFIKILIERKSFLTQRRKV